MYLQWKSVLAAVRDHSRAALAISRRLISCARVIALNTGLRLWRCCLTCIGLAGNAVGSGISRLAAARPRLRVEARLGAIVVMGLAGVALLFTIPRKSHEPPSGRGQTRIGVLVVNTEQEGRFLEFRGEMERRGYHESPTLRYLNPGSLNSDPEMIRGATRRMIEARVSVILALGTQSAQIAKPMAQEAGIPLVFTAQTPIKAGVVSTFRHHGQAVTGVADERSMGRRLQLLRMVLPGLKRVYIPYNSEDPAALASLADLGVMLGKCNIDWTSRPVRNEGELVSALEKIPANVEAIFILSDALITSHTSLLVESGLQRSIPVCGPNRFSAERGAVLAYGPDFGNDGKALARLVDQVLQGTDPRDLPVEVSPSILAVNRRVADRLRLAIPGEIISQADVVIE